MRGITSRYFRFVKMAWFLFSVLLLVSLAANVYCWWSSYPQKSPTRKPSLCKGDDILYNLKVTSVTGTSAIISFTPMPLSCTAEKQELQLKVKYKYVQDNRIATKTNWYIVKPSTKPYLIIPDLLPCTRYLVSAQVILKGGKESNSKTIAIYTPTESSQEIRWSVDLTRIAQLCRMNTRESTPTTLFHPPRTIKPTTTTKMTAVTIPNTTFTSVKNASESVDLKSSTSNPETLTKSSTRSTLQGKPIPTPPTSTSTSKLVIFIKFFLILTLAVLGVVLKYRGRTICGRRWIIFPEEAPAEQHTNELYSMSPLNEKFHYHKIF